MSGPVRSRAASVVRRVREVRGTTEATALKRRVDSLETAVAENTGLHGPLTDRVARIERDVMTCLAQRHPDNGA